MFKIDKRTKLGSYTLVMTAAVLAMLIIANVLVLNLPSRYTKLDVTSNSFYTLSEMTKKEAENIDEKVNIYMLVSGGEDASGGSGNGLPMLSLFLTRYAELNDNIEFEIIDPIKSPTFTDAYSGEGLDDYSIIVESEKRHKVISFSDLYYYYSDSTGKISADQYQSYVYYYYYNYGSYPNLTLSFDGENKISSALDYVTTERIPVLYALEGHGEVAFSETLKANIENDSMELKTLNLLTGEIPDDAECLIINVPTSDINADEKERIASYLDRGGMLFLTTLYTGSGFTNLSSLLSEYGLSSGGEMIVEGDTSRHYTSSPTWLLPKASSESTLTSSLASSVYMFMPYSHGIISDGETEKNVTAEPLFTTSSMAYTISSDAETTEKTEGSAEGPFDVAVLCEDNDSGARIVWFGSPAFDDSINSITGGNYSYFSSVLDGTIERESISLGIDANDIVSSTLVVNEAQINIWSSIFVIIIPAAVAIIGLCAWLVRRRK